MIIYKENTIDLPLEFIFICGTERCLQLKNNIYRSLQEDKKEIIKGIIFGFRWNYTIKRVIYSIYYITKKYKLLSWFTQLFYNNLLFIESILDSHIRRVSLDNFNKNYRWRNLIE